MERSAYAFATGLFVIALGLGLLAAARWLQGPEVERRPYQVVAKSSVAGLSPYSKVYYRGVEVGQVTAIRFARDGSRDILIDVALEPRVPVTVNTYAVLKSQGLTGLAFIELLDDGPLDAPELQTSGTDPGRIEMRPSLLESFQTVGQGIAEQMAAQALIQPDFTFGEPTAEFMAQYNEYTAAKQNLLQQGEIRSEDDPALEALRQRYFSGSELLRVKTLDRAEMY